MSAVGSEYHTAPIAAHVVFLRNRSESNSANSLSRPHSAPDTDSDSNTRFVDCEVLLGKRAAGTWAAGSWHLPSGHVENGEPVDVAACREAGEEVGIDLRPTDLQFAHVMHRKDDDEYVGFFFVVQRWSGEPTNLEPTKCDELQWFSLDQLPENIVPYCHQALQSIAAGEPFDASRFPVTAGAPVIAGAGVNS